MTNGFVWRGVPPPVFDRVDVDGEVPVGWGQSCRVGTAHRSRGAPASGVGPTTDPQPPDFSLESEKEISLVSNLTSPLPLRSATLRGARRARSIEYHRSARGRRSGNRELWGGLVGARGSVFLGTRASGRGPGDARGPRTEPVAPGTGHSKRREPGFRPPPHLWGRVNTVRHEYCWQFDFIVNQVATGSSVNLFTPTKVGQEGVTSSSAAWPALTSSWRRALSRSPACRLKDYFPRWRRRKQLLCRTLLPPFVRGGVLLDALMMPRTRRALSGAWEAAASGRAA
jgi:hypothetical protein